MQFKECLLIVKKIVEFLSENIWFHLLSHYTALCSKSAMIPAEYSDRGYSTSNKSGSSSRS